MDIFEFELRYKSFEGLGHKFSLGREKQELIKLVKISNQGVPDKKIQEISPDELKQLTTDTYSTYKKEKLQEYTTQQLPYQTLDKYVERLEYELKVIKEMGFNTYMLIVSDFVNWARDNEIVVGPGRGSGAGSLLAWVTGITEINPFAYDLLFERFLNPARITMPDFDIDFEDTQRERVIEYVTQKYGKSKVCYIGTYMKMATKAAFKDAARAMGIPFDKANKISNIIPERSSLIEAVTTADNNEEIKNYYDNDENVKKAIDLGGKLEGNLRQTGVHACGFIIAPENITDYTAIQPMGKGSESYVSQYDGPTLETIGLLKMDFLGLRNLSVIKNAIKIIAARHKVGKEGVPIIYDGLSKRAIQEYQQEKLPELFSHFLETMQFEPALDDMYTYEKVFQKGDTSGIFQFEGQGMRRFLIMLEPNDINDLIAMSALYRPGPLEFIPTYINRKHGKEEIDYMLPVLEEMLKEKYPEEKNLVEEERKKLIEDLDPIMGLTYGIAVYQEQLMFLVQSMAGFSLPEADLLRRGVGKKKKAVIEKLKKEFIERSQSHRGYKPETGKIIYEKMIEPAAAYSFNKSHAACYSHIAYQTGFLKAHYPLEFYASLLRSVEEDTDKFSFFVDEILTSGLKVLPPDVNKSYNHVAAVEDHVRVGFLACKGIGYSVGEFIEQERNANGQYTSLEDFLTRCESIITKKSLESLIKSGAFDSFDDRKTMLEAMPQIIERTKASKNMDAGLFGGMIESQLTFAKHYETPIMEKLLMDFAIFKTFIVGHPFDGLYPMLKKKNFVTQFKEIPEAGEFEITAYVKKIQRARKKGFFVTMEDATDSFEIFLKEMLDIKLFDIFHIKGYKGRTTTIDSMVKVTVEELIAKAKKGKKYDPQRTVARVKATRKSKVRLQDKITEPSDQKQQTKSGSGENKHIEQEQSSIKPQKNPGNKGNERNEGNKKNENESKKESKESSVFALPEGMSTLQKVIAIIKQYPGEKEITIGTKKVLIDQTGLDEISKLLS